MPKRLIIVESPSKARTLAKFLGSEYTTKASMGHVRDLPKSRLGVDIEHGFAPEYEVTKEQQIRELRAAAKRADDVLLATDPDREGEAIAWHLAEALHLREPQRIVVHEITKPAVEAALQQPRPIDRHLVAAQEARRVIDRLVGYQVSPLLWKKVRTGLSAGRVQSVAVRLVVDREREIEAFVPEEWWSLEARLVTEAGEEVTAQLRGRVEEPAGTPSRGSSGDAAEISPTAVTAEDGAAVEEDVAEAAEATTTSDRDGAAEQGRFRLADRAAAEAIMAALAVDTEGRPSAATPPFRVVAVQSTRVTRNPPLPYTTSTLQQDASSRLRLSPSVTMRIAQQLYEGVELGDEGAVGLITYMRTDSTRVSDLAHAAASEFVTETFGADYVRRQPHRQRRRQPAHVQDAHEAIRPTDVRRTPESVARYLTRDQLRLYELIWRRFVASEMAPALYRNTRVDLVAGGYVFRATGTVLLFDGFTKVWRRDEERDERRLPELEVDDELRCLALVAERHVTQPPPRYTEATLVKELEERGIGRPSTYAPTIETIQERGYVRQEDRRLVPTELGKTVDALLRQHLPEIVDVDFTAELEKRLDRIEEGRRKYETTVREWYIPFARTLAKAERELDRVLVSTGERCPECQEGELVVRRSRYGEFVGCSRYPECRYIKRESSPPEPTGEACPLCGRELVVRRGRRGPFVGCSGYPECTYVRSDRAPSPEGEATAAEGDGATPTDLGTCPECGRPLVKRWGRRGPFVGCSGYPECRYVQPRSGETARRPFAEPTGEACPECGQPLVRRQGRRGPFVGCSAYPRCRYVARSSPTTAVVS